MYSILPLIFSLLLVSCGKHIQDGFGGQGTRDVQQVTTESLLNDILTENIEGLNKYHSLGGDLEVELSSGRTLLTEACTWSKYKVIEFLVSRKVSFEKKDRFGKSAIDYSEENIKIKRSLFPELVIELKKNLIDVIRLNRMSEIKAVLEAMPPVNFYLESAFLGTLSKDDEGETLLTFCVKIKSENALRLLVQPKFELDVNLKNKNGISALQMSRKLGFKNIEKLLLKVGAIDE
ncbi:MAG: hypothetical protein AB7I27_08210 [Bacteriovoracaceae bacterium]